MSIVHKEGKDTIIFATKEDHESPSSVSLPEPEPSPGLILPNGEINWNCPCLGGMATGPCGLEFREAYSCFHYSTAEPKGSNCFEAFTSMQSCMSEYPSLYGNKDSDDLDMDNDDNEQEEHHHQSSPSKTDSTAEEKIEEDGSREDSKAEEKIEEDGSKKDNIAVEKIEEDGSENEKPAKNDGQIQRV